MYVGKQKSKKCMCAFLELLFNNYFIEWSYLTLSSILYNILAHVRNEKNTNTFFHNNFPAI